MKKYINNPIIKGIILLFVGVGIGWLIKPSGMDGEMKHEVHQTKDGTTWTCSMHPQIRQPEPGKCPICGMDLIPLEEESASNNPGMVKMSPTAMQLANVSTTIIGKGDASKTIRLNGKVQADERLIFSQVSHFEGRVEALAVNFTGEYIRKGQKLGEIYAPQLVSAQEELFTALSFEPRQEALVNAAKNKLKNWKLSDAQIEEIIQKGNPVNTFPLISDVSGYVLGKMVNPGDYVNRGKVLFQVVDLSRVWVLFDVYESDLAFVKVGTEVKFTLQAIPGKEFSGKISFIDPLIDPQTRVAQARLVINNSSLQLKPEMFATGRVQSSRMEGKDQILVPKSAVMWTGERSVVYVKNEDETGFGFYAKEVTLGPLAGDAYVVKKGLDPGMEVVTNGTFSIDAAAQLAGKTSMMNPQSGGPKYPLEGAAKEYMQSLFDHYFEIKDALVATDAKKTAQKAKEALVIINSISGSELSGPAESLWNTKKTILKKAFESIASTDDVEKQREAFIPLSNTMIQLSRAFGGSNNDLYIQHCPMADNNTGADWLSLQKEIRNPYFGDKMLTCGTVKDVISR
jgi:Cu(I)/Ag(I) efflux system membrane fusion protein